MERDARRRERKDDGFMGKVKEWAPAGAVVLALAVFAGKITAIPDEVAKLKEQVTAQAQTNAVQDEQIKTIVTLLTDIRNDLRERR